MKFIGCILTTLVCQILVEEGSTTDPPKCTPGSWVPASNGDYPRGALAVGDNGGNITYLIRAIHNGKKLPGNLHGGVAYVAEGSGEHKYSNYEVFCNSDDQGRWQPFEGGNIPINALIVSKNSLSEPVYVCRGIVNNTYSAGKVINGACYVGSSLHDYWLSKYDIFVDGPANIPGCKPGTWVPASNGDFLSGAVLVGSDNGKNAYLIRAIHNGELIPGKVYEGSAYVSDNDREHGYKNYEVLCGGYGLYFWQPYRGGTIPSNALIFDEDSRSGPKYACREIVKNKNYSAGKVVNGVCYLSYGGIEYKETQFDILVENPLSDTEK